jgi:enterochelin esterase-like enzyme
VTPALTAVCRQLGTTVIDEIAVPEDGTTFSPTIYLPPCYADDPEAVYPVLYWTAIGGQVVFDTADKLILQGGTSPFIMVMIDVDAAAGYGADARIPEYVVPYIDAHYRTQSDREHRSITGISHGAAIAVRAAFYAPDVFSRVAVISGGISDTEQDKFTQWILAAPREQWPGVLVDVGDQDGIITLTRYLLNVLDRQGVPYTFTQGKGNHDFTYWSGRMADYLEWLEPVR